MTIVTIIFTNTMPIHFETYQFVSVSAVAFTGTIKLKQSWVDQLEDRNSAESQILTGNIQQAVRRELLQVDLLHLWTGTDNTFTLNYSLEFIFLLSLFVADETNKLAKPFSFSSNEYSWMTPISSRQKWWNSGTSNSSNIKNENNLVLYKCNVILLTMRLWANVFFLRIFIQRAVKISQFDWSRGVCD